MFDETKKRIVLSKNPDTYYGFSITVENLMLNSKLYIGFGNKAEVMIVEEIHYEEYLNFYEIHTDKAVLLAAPLTRIAYSLIN